VANNYPRHPAKYYRQDGTQIFPQQVNNRLDLADPRSYVPTGDGYIAVVNKGGSTSISHGSKRIRRSEADLTRPVTMYVRNPVDRFISGWRYFSWDHPEFIHYPHQLSGDAWFEYITDFAPLDLHWLPFTAVHQIQEHWTLLPLSALPGKKFNEGKKYNEPLPKRLQDKVEEFYKGDMAVWRSVTGKS